MEPQVQYARTSDGVSIAFWTIGEGVPLVVMPFIPWNHVQLEWRQPDTRRWYETLAENRRVVRYDVRGTGMSDRDAVDFSMQAMVRSVEAVVARAGLEKFAISATVMGVLIAVTYAVAWPKRVSHLILADGWTKFSEVEESAAWEAEKALRDKDWVIYTETFMRVLWGVQDQEFARQVAEYLRACVEPDAHRAVMAAMECYDISASLPKVAAPTLVVHNQKCPWAPVQAGQR